MVEISDELRELAVKYCYQWTKTYKDMCAIADRIDAEMVELPKSADGKIWTGREVYFWTGATEVDRHEFNSLTYINGRWCVEDKHWQRYPAESVWYERPDSFECIADELEAWCDDVDVDGDACDEPRELAVRIRKLAKKDG
jgi:hypothetical protein